MNSSSSFLARSDSSAWFSWVCICSWRSSAACCCLASLRRCPTCISSMPRKITSAAISSTRAGLVRCAAFFFCAMCARLLRRLFLYHSALAAKRKGFFPGSGDFFRQRRHPRHRAPQKARRGRRCAQPEVPQRPQQRRQRQHIQQRAQPHGAEHHQPQLALAHPQGIPQQRRSHRQQIHPVQHMGQPSVFPAAEAHRPQQIVHRRSRRAQRRRRQIAPQLRGDNGAHLRRTGG